LLTVCMQGYSSALAAALLVELGVDAGDLIGGFEAW
jgi:rhodanese-related sulfurtransferase